MVTRVFHPKDVIPLRNIHEKYFKEQFQLPPLMHDNNLLVFTIPNKEDKPIIVGIVRQILELITVTDQSVPVLVRQEALITALGMAAVVATKHDYNQIHAFVSDAKWANIMKNRAGFATCKGEALYFNI